MRIDIWSDVVCPFCFIGKRRLEAALAATPAAENADIVWHSFELDRGAPALAGTHTDLLAAKYGMTEAQVQAADSTLTGQAAEAGLEFHLAESKPGNTFDAHRLIHLAAESGLQGTVEERFFRAYFTESVAIGDRSELRRIAVDAGLDADRVEQVLATDEFADAVRADEAAAVQLGVSGVPFFVIDGKFAVSGAQPVAVFVDALARAAEDPVVIW